MSVERQMAQSINERLHQIAPPPPRLDVVVQRGRTRRTRRYVGVAIMSTIVLYAGVLGLQALYAVDSDGVVFDPKPQEFPAVGQLDFSQGLRAYMSPDSDGKLWLGGRSFPVRDLAHIDTDATATPYGMVYFDRAQRAHLLREDGVDVPLAPAPAAPAKGFHPSSKADARLPLVAWTEHGAKAVTVRLHDLRAGVAVDSIDVPCEEKTCAKVRVVAVDQGLVFVSTAKGTYVWDPSGERDRRWTRLSGPETAIADVRNKRILHTGEAPQPARGSPIDRSWSFAKGPIDAQLSFDGRHMLYWSTRLRPVAPDARPIQLDVPTAEFAFVAFDTDGSVLVAPPQPNPTTTTVYDCEIPSGACTMLGQIKTTSGDPIFIGADM